MAVSRYPRAGQRLAPAVLRELLNSPIPRRLLGRTCTERMHFADLDASAWTRFGPKACGRLGKALVKLVQARLAALPRALYNHLLPRLPEGLRFDDLTVEPRTAHCLDKMQVLGLLHEVQDLSSLTIGQILAISGFGAKSLLDLLTALEAVAVEGADEPALPGSGVATSTVHARGASPLGEGVFLPIQLSVLRNLRLPKLPAAIQLTDLPLGKRTAECLERHGFLENLAALENYTVAGLLALPGFGIQCLLDLLDGIETYRHAAGGPSAAPQDAFAIPKLCGEEHTSLEEELHSLVLWSLDTRGTSLTERNVQMALRYFGFDGAGRASLGKIGAAHGVTRERVRQICLLAERALESSVPPAPLLDRTLSFVAAQLPRAAEALESTLCEKGLTLAPFRLKGLVKAAKLLGRTVPFALEEVDGRRMAVHAEAGPGQVTKTILEIARKTTSHFGVATVSDIAARVQERTSSPVTPEFVIGVLEGRPTLEWLDQEAGWFWLRWPSQNRVVSRIHKILAVAGEIEVSELRRGITRHYLMKGCAPPRLVLLELCKRLSGCRVEGTLVRADPEIDWRQVLRGTEHAMIQVLSEHGRVLQRAKFEELCLERGMNPSTFYMYLNNSPVIERFAQGVYGIRGTKIDPRTVTTLSPESHLTTVRLDYGWAEDQKIWIGYRLSEGILSTGTFSIPGRVKRFLQGSFVLKGADEQSLGMLVIKGYSGRGLRPFFGRRGGESGDTLLLEFDVKTKEATVSIGDEDLLEPYQGTQTRSLGAAELGSLGECETSTDL